MKQFICITLILLTSISSCKPMQRQNNTSKDNPVDNTLAVDTCSCKADYFFKLKNSLLLSNFFSKLDSVILLQYKRAETKTIKDITPEMLVTFIDDIDRGAYSQKNYFSKEYTYNLAPANITPSFVHNVISISFYPDDCSYRLSLNNTYSTDEYTEETSVIYSFKIMSDKITNLSRQEAG